MRAAHFHVAVTSAMTTLVLFAVAALAFTILAGVIEGFWARRDRRRLHEKSSRVLHPLAHHGLRRVRDPFAWRAFRHAALFVGFLVISYLALLSIRAVRGLVAGWL
jgi:hypothetical protein